MGKHTQGKNYARMNKGPSKQGGKQLSKRERWEQSKQVETKRAEARKMELARRKRRNAVAAAVLVTCIISFGFLYNANFLWKDEPLGDNGTIIIPGDSGINIPKSEITENVSFYRYDDDGTEIRTFGVRGPDGKEHIAADACDQCYREKKGYRQEGDNMTCNNCGQSFEINSIGTENTEGGCWPSFVEIDSEGENIVITEEALKDKRYLFE